MDSDHLAELSDLCGTFDMNSMFAEENLVLGSALTPKRTLRKALLSYVDKQRAYAENKTLEEHARARMTKINGDLLILDRIRKTVDCEFGPDSGAIPAYRGSVYVGGKAQPFEFDPEQIVAVYSGTEWPECRKHLLAEVDACIATKGAELNAIDGSYRYRQKLMQDTERALAWYEEKLPELDAAARASKLTA